MKRIIKLFFLWGMCILIFAIIALTVFNFFYNKRYSDIFDKLYIEAQNYLVENYPEEIYIEEKSAKGWFNDFNEPFVFYAHPENIDDLWFKVTYKDGEFTDNYFDRYLQRGAGNIIEDVVSEYSSDYLCFAGGDIKDEIGFKDYYYKNGKMLDYKYIEYTSINEIQIQIYDHAESRNAEEFLGKILDDIQDLELLEEHIVNISFFVINPNNSDEYTAYYYYYDGEFELGSKYTATE